MLFLFNKIIIRLILSHNKIKFIKKNYQILLKFLYFLQEFNNLKALK